MKDSDKPSQNPTGFKTDSGMDFSTKRSPGFGAGGPGFRPRPPAGPRPGFDRDLTKGNLFKNLFSLAWPMVVNNSLNMLGPTIDMVWVGRLGPAAIAGVGAAGMGMMILMPAMMGLTMGTRAIIARAIGAGDEWEANHAAQQAFVLSIGFSMCIAIIGIFFSEAILRLLGMKPEVVDQGGNYLRIIFVGSIAMSGRFISTSIMQASGDAKSPMKVMIFTRLFHILLSPFLILGWWIFPRFGTNGAALTNIFSQSLGLGLSLWILLSGRTRLTLTLRGFKIDPPIILRMVRIGVPALVSGVAQPFAMTLLMRIIASFGTLAVATYALCNRIQMLLMMAGMALGMAAGIIAGQNLGAKQPDQAEKSIWLAVGIVQLIMLCGSFILYFGAHDIVRIFSPDPALLTIATNYLRILTVGFAIMGLNMVVMQSLTGVGDTVPPMALNLLMMWIVQIPLAYYLPSITKLGVYAIPWAAVASMYLGTICFFIYFRTGRWKTKIV